MLAAYHGHATLVRLLLSRGADPDRLNDRGQSPLAGVIFKDEKEIVDILLESGADVDLGRPSAAETARLFKKTDEYDAKFEAARARGRKRKAEGMGGLEGASQMA